MAAVKHPDFASCEAGLNLSPMAAWVFIADTIRFWWVNDAAIELWNGADREELFAREMLPGVPEKVVVRIRDVVARVSAGNPVRTEWIIYPQGVMTTILLDIRGVTLPDGRLGLLCYAQPTQEEVAPSILRSVAMFRNAGAMSVLVGAGGEILWRNPTAMHAFGELDSWLAWLREPSEGAAILDEVVGGGMVEQRIGVVARGEPRWHRVEAHQLRDPVTAELCAMIEHVDVSEAVEAETLAVDRGHTIDELNDALNLVERQRAEILELSAPMLDIGQGTLAVPLIGQLDQEQSEALMVKLLDAVAQRGTRTVLLDVTGLATVDERSARYLSELSAALTLLGATPKLTGIGPRLAAQLSGLGIELDGVETLRSLADALRRR